MNLIIDPWIPVVDHDATRKHVSLKELLCSPGPFTISLRRDDLELAALQLAICLTQVMLAPKDENEFVQRLQSPLSPDIYDHAAAPFLDMFVVDHPEQPFMQRLGVLAKKTTSIQKLFPGLPAGDGTAWLFNTPHDVMHVCPSCIAIGLFQQASCATGFGGGFKDPLRGKSPLTSLVHNHNTRKCIWKNIINKKYLQRLMPPNQKTKDAPTWIQHIEENHRYQSTDIGLLRGLFWQPSSIQILWHDGNTSCDICGIFCNRYSNNFLKNKFKYTFDDNAWPHPHTPKKFTKEKWKYLSYSYLQPAWTYIPSILLNNKEYEAAPCVLHYKTIDSTSNIILILGGYVADQASILERRHDLVPLPAGWGEHTDDLIALLNIALTIRDVFRKKVYGLGKALGAPSLHLEAIRLFYDRSEEYIHAMLRELNWDSFDHAQQEMSAKFIHLSLSILDELVEPYAHKPETFKKTAVTRATLGKEFKKIKEGLQ
ncbi:MAG: type I-E CRISPR-associated protein Cse1/CasA [Thermodesulfobacteriota bacterium]